MLDIISAEEEARLAVLGCHLLLEPGDGPAMIFDIGGGSTELVLIEPTAAMPRIVDWWSAPWGVVSLTESEGTRTSADDRGGSPPTPRCASASRHGFASSPSVLPRSARRHRGCSAPAAP